MTAKLILFAAFVISMLLMSINHKKKKKKIVFFGDSITRQGGGLGGFIRLLEQLLQEVGISDNYELVVSGVDGDRVHDLLLRMDEDVLAKGADIVVIFAGVNDVGYGSSGLTGTNFFQFEAFYTTIIERLLSAQIKIILCTPGLIGENTAFSSKEDAHLDRYSSVVRALAPKFELPLVDIRKSFIDYILANNYENKAFGVLTSDKVHLNNKGNQVLAAELYKVLQPLIQQ